MARVSNAGRKARRSEPTRVRAKGVSRNGKRGSEHVDGKEKAGQKAEARSSQREKLIRERDQVIEELTRLRAELQEAPEPTGDEVDLNVYEREKTLGLVAAYELRLEKMDNALRAAEKGEYGICQRCGRPIDPARLKIFPETRHCVSCQGELERLAKRRGA